MSETQLPADPLPNVLADLMVEACKGSNLLRIPDNQLLVAFGGADVLERLLGDPKSLLRALQANKDQLTDNSRACLQATLLRLQVSRDLVAKDPSMTEEARARWTDIDIALDHMKEHMNAIKAKKQKAAEAAVNTENDDYNKGAEM